jgi:hypothetical protein
VNTRAEIKFTPFKRSTDRLEGIRQLRPVHVARFSETFELHGRLYTGRYGQQALRGFERQTIRINGQPTIELDFCGMHPRLLYHLLGIEYADDPYLPNGTATTTAQRLLAKRIVNTAINANSRRATIEACNAAAQIFDRKGKRKCPRDVYVALELQDAMQKTRWTFDWLYDWLVEAHRPIRRYFNSDYGIRLMRLDGSIALEVLHRFAEQGVPALGIHDSFIVPIDCKRELREAMHDAYRAHANGFDPIIKAHSSMQVLNAA